jgi:hypothetical protein
MRLDRRRLLLSAGAAGALAGLGLPGIGQVGPEMKSDGESWRHLFVLDRDPLFMNVGTVGSPPREVLRPRPTSWSGCAAGAVELPRHVPRPPRSGRRRVRL